jgi:FkbM family methyltransferase
MIETIQEHTIDTSLLTGGWIIDAGCRNWNFSIAMKERNEKVYALDIQSMVKPETLDIFKQNALWITNKTMHVNYVHDTNGTFISDNKQSNKTEEILTITLKDIYNEIGTNIDCLKMDIEGSEYDILMDEQFRAIPKQLSIEFHEHNFKNKHDKLFNSCIQKISKYYVPIKFERVPAHGAGFNYWDTLFINKEYIK